MPESCCSREEISFHSVVILKTVFLRASRSQSVSGRPLSVHGVVWLPVLALSWDPLLGPPVPRSTAHVRPSRVQAGAASLRWRQSPGQSGAEHTPSRAGAAVRRRAVRASWIAHGVCTSSPGASITVPQGGFSPISVTDPEPQEATEAHSARALGQHAEFTHGLTSAVPGPPATAPPPWRPCPRSTFRDAGRGASRLTEGPRRGTQGPREPAAPR